MTLNKFNLMGRGSKSVVIPYNVTDLKLNYTMNTGNMIFFHACEHIFSLDDFRYGWGGGNYSNTKGIVIPMANQIGSHFDLLASGPKINEIPVPVVALGLGAQSQQDEIDIDSIPEGSKVWLQKLASKSNVRNISVRGKRTEKILHQLGVGSSCIALGCPSLLINNSLELGSIISSKAKDLINSGRLFSAISVAAGDPYHKNSQLICIERKLIELIERHNGRYTVQNPLVLMALSSGWKNDIPKEDINLVQKRWFPTMDSEGLFDWFANKSDLFLSATQWIHNYQRKSLVVGTRIHGIQAAIQAGTPAICIYIDSRTKELCEMMKIPSISWEEISINSDLEKVFTDVLTKWDGQDFDHNRLKLAYKTKYFLEQNNIQFNKESILGRFNKPLK